MVAVENRFLRALKRFHHPSEPVSETNKEKLKILLSVSLKSLIT